MKRWRLNALTSPRDYGLPYEGWWDGQYESIKAIEKAFEKKKIVFLIMDTGGGKSGVAIATSRSFNSTTVLTRTISLEEQYGIVAGVEIGRGRRWHKCLYGKEPLVCYQEGLDNDDAKCRLPCEYKQHIDRLHSQRLRVLNYSQYYSLNASDQHFRSQLVVCDEAHGLEGTLLGFGDFWYEDEARSTWGNELSHHLFDYGDKFLLMSASMIPSLVAETLGIEVSDYEVVEAPVTFDPRRSPIYVTPVGYITNNRPHIDRIVKWIDSHLVNTTAKGVVHTSSDKQTQEILDATRYRDRFIWPKGQDRANAFKRFKSSGEDAVLISASAYEGQDFPDNECRWQIICKVPYASLGDERVRARREERPDIYRLEAMQRIQQACGRGMRNPDDWCNNFILDATVLGLYDKYGGLLSERFRASWVGAKR